MHISDLEQKILALQRGEIKTASLAMKVIDRLVLLGFEYEDAAATYNFKDGGYVRVWDNGYINFPDNAPGPEAAIIAALAEIIADKAESLKMRNRQIRNLRRSLTQVK